MDKLPDFTQDLTHRPIWDIASGQVIQTVADHMKSVTSIAFSQDGKLLASASSDGTIKLWEVTA